MTYVNERQFRKLVEPIAAGDKSVLRGFFDVYGNLIYLMAKGICRSHFDADEVINDVLVTIWKKAKYVCTVDNPHAWLRTVIANAAKDKLRKRRFLPLDFDICDPNDEYDRFACNEQFSYLIRELNEIEQAVLIYKFVEDLTFDEIAHILEKQLSSIASTYYRAIKKIEKYKIKRFFHNLA